MTGDEMRALVAAAPVARLATVGADGAPHLVPFCFALDGDVLYSAVDRKPKRTPELRRLANAAAEPRVCVLVDHYEDDWSRLWWVRLDGRARRLDAAGDGPEAERARDALVEKYPQYRASRPDGPVLRIDIARWSGWSGSSGG
jgi:PPOX class probable F420-dependent enzyme